MEEEEGDLMSRTILGEVSQRSIEEIVEETQPNKERSGKIPSQAEDLNDYPSMLSRQNLHQEGEEESLPGKDWIKIGNEYFKNPVPKIPHRTYRLSRNLQQIHCFNRDRTISGAKEISKWLRTSTLFLAR
ncbi:hypothetical protein Pyn_15998 [Prunus yedoensis var. nudiflora]|uniref:Uncharacterized protein n=1 Tax=Prunus yedoensis var. nudiflora TaxID=2094558 RepID=A0A314YH02_PRUYE|nr:hypothetical protein Pyn_15998 [Prunus yedoensis var. nudiflora]